MSYYAYFSLFFMFICLLAGCRMPEMASPEEIGKMKDVVEVSNYFASHNSLIFGKWRPIGAHLYKRCRDPEKIKAIMEAIKKIKKNPAEYLIAFEYVQTHLRFKDKSGRILCMEYLLPRYGTAINGCNYEDKSGDLYDAMQKAGFVGPPIPKPPFCSNITESIKRIQILPNVVEIGRYKYDSDKYKNYDEAYNSYDVKLITVCNDPDKIALVMEAIRKLDVSSKPNIPKDMTEHLCFKVEAGYSFGMIVSFVGGKEIEGYDFIDKTGILYDALQNAGLAAPPLSEPKNTIEPSHPQ